jgi:hypothetical protein
MIYLPENSLASQMEIWQCESATPGFRFFGDSARIAKRERERERERERKREKRG